MTLKNFMHSTLFKLFLRLVNSKTLILKCIHIFKSKIVVHVL